MARRDARDTASRRKLTEEVALRLRVKSIVSWILSVALVGAGLALVGLFLSQGSGDPATNEKNPEGFNVPEVQPTGRPAVGGPKDNTLKLTIPRMARVKDATVPDAAGDDTEALDSNVGIHLTGTGFPWQEVANVYIAGHRLGYPRTDSFLAFFDLKKLKKGNKVFVEDANGKSYTYKVFREFVVSPTDVSVTRPVEGKNILTLQTCTLPDYSRRLIMQAELVEDGRG